MDELSQYNKCTREIAQTQTVLSIPANNEISEASMFTNEIKGRSPSVPQRVKCQYVVNMYITCMLNKCHQRDDEFPPPNQSPSPDQTRYGPF